MSSASSPLMTDALKVGLPDEADFVQSVDHHLTALNIKREDSGSEEGDSDTDSAGSPCYTLLQPVANNFEQSENKNEESTSSVRYKSEISTPPACSDPQAHVPQLCSNPISNLEETVVMVIQEEIDHLCNVLEICPDPMKWSVNDVNKWIVWYGDQFGASQGILDKFRITGEELCSLSMDEFRQKSVEAGVNFHYQLEVWKNASQLNLANLNGAMHDGYRTPHFLSMRSITNEVSNDRSGFKYLLHSSAVPSDITQEYPLHSPTFSDIAHDGSSFRYPLQSPTLTNDGAHDSFGYARLSPALSISSDGSSQFMRSDEYLHPVTATPNNHLYSATNMYSQNYTPLSDPHQTYSDYYSYTEMYNYHDDKFDSSYSQSADDFSIDYQQKQTIHLWRFLKELLLQPEKYDRCIRWVDRQEGIFKIEDSPRVAKLWGKRKNRPAMNYDKLSRSIRQYYRKGIIKKTANSKRLVYQFCPAYL